MAISPTRRRVLALLAAGAGGAVLPRGVPANTPPPEPGTPETGLVERRLVARPTQQVLRAARGAAAPAT